MLMRTLPSLAFLALLSSCAVAMEESPATVYVRADPAKRSWKIGNAQVERTVTFDPAQGLTTRSWIHKTTGKDFLEGADGARRQAGEFIFQAGGKRITGASRFDLIGDDVSVRRAF
jgi:hypothetical protein